MKKSLLLSVAALSLTVGSVALADDAYVAGGFEASGHVNVVAGWSHSDKDAQFAGNFGSAMGEFLGNNGGNDDDTFAFLIDEVELDISKTFGENVRLRADIEFSPVEDGGAPGALNVTESSVANLEQAYVTVNVPVGDGAELLFGKFNVPIGFESVDRNELLTVSHSNVYNFLTPTNATGAKFYVAFNDLVDLSLYVVNDLNRDGFSDIVNGVGDSAIPSVGGRLGFNWGEEGSESTVGLSAAAGPEQPQQNAHWDYLADIDFSLHVTDALLIGGEAIYRQSNRTVAESTVDANDYKAYGAQLLFNYQFSDVWDGTLRFDYIHDMNARAAAAAGLGGARFSGVDEQIMAGTVVAGYQITDGAKFKLEYKFEYADPQGTANNSDYHSVVGMFAYNF